MYIKNYTQMKVTFVGKVSLWFVGYVTLICYVTFNVGVIR